MGSINNSINLTDRMSPVLKKVLKALDSTMKAMDQLDRATNKGMNSSAFKRAKADIDAASSAVSSLNGRLEKTGSLMDRVSQKAAKTAAAMYGAGVINREVYRQGGGKLLGIKGAAQMGAGMFFEGVSKTSSVMKDFSGTVSSGFNTISAACSLAYTETLSFINLVEKGIEAINGLMYANDAATSDIAKIGLFNYDKNMSNAQAYGMAYRAAQNSRSDLSDTTNLINRIMMSGVYGQKAGSLGSATRMAEILNKALVVGGGTGEENRRALIQLSQGLSSGRLQGDELRSIREQAPYLASVLAEGLNKIDDRFIGTTVGDLKKLGSQGELTSDVVIKALEAMQDQVDATFEDKAPRTWAQGLTDIQNTIKVVTAYLQSMEGGPLSKISELVWTISEYLKSEDGIRVMVGIATALSFVGEVTTWVIQAALTGISWIINNSAILLALLIVLTNVAVVAGVAMLVGFLAATWPILLIITLIALVIYALQQLGISVENILGFICGIVAVAGSILVNIGIGVINSILQLLWFFVSPFIRIVEWILNVCNGGFNSFGDAVANLIGQIIGWFLNLGKVLTTIIDAIFGTDWTSGLESLQNTVTEWGKNDKDITLNKNAPAIDYRMNYGDAWTSGYDFGSGITDKIGGLSSGLTDFMEGNKSLYDNAEGVNIAGGNLDSVGSIKNDVNINDEDIQLLRDMAARDYLLNLQQITPVAHISFGDVRETADVNKIMDVIEDMVEEQMATSLVSN